jgi:hypothetical protein
MSTVKSLVESMIQDWVNAELNEEGFRVVAKDTEDYSTFKSGIKKTEQEAKALADKMKKAKDKKGFALYSDVKVVKESYAVTHKGQPFAYFDTEAEAKKHLEKYAKKGDASSYKVVKEDLNEASDYKVMHKSFTDAVNTAKEKAEKAGYTIDDDEWFRKVSSGPKKPGTDKTNRYTVELMTKKGGAAKKALHFQVYNTGGAYELNAYIN